MPGEQPKVLVVVFVPHIVGPYHLMIELLGETDPVSVTLGEEHVIVLCDKALMVGVMMFSKTSVVVT